jgi:alpha-galactosidase
LRRKSLSAEALAREKSVEGGLWQKTEKRKEKMNIEPSRIAKNSFTHRAMRMPGLVLVLLTVLITVNLSEAFESPMQPLEEELKQSRQFAASCFEDVPPPAELTVKLEEVSGTGKNIVHGQNGHSMRVNQMWEDLPLKIGGQLYYSGVYSHANTRIRVKLPSKGVLFSALIGIDSTDVTKSGQGSAVFSVLVKDKCLYRSGILRGGMAAVPISVKLDDTDELLLELSDGGDGIYCDCGDWANAKVVLKDGQEVPLGEPLTHPIKNIPPFSFKYGGKDSSELLRDWPVERNRRTLDAGRVAHTITWTDPKTALQVRCEGIEYLKFPTIEWTVYFKNTGETETPILSKIMGIDLQLQRNSVGEFTLHHQVGSPATIDDYGLLQDSLKPGLAKHLGASGGRPLNVSMPYFNVQWYGAGAILVIGWPGQWGADFIRDRSTGLQVRGGQELTELKLQPGEEIRSSLTVAQFYLGQTIRAQNIWRRWMMEYNVPRPGGKMLQPQWSAMSGVQFADMTMANEANQKHFIDRYLDEDIKIDYWWMDFGWFYYKPPNIHYEADLERFPGGLRAITDYARSKRVKSMVWFEPENVNTESDIYRQHPDWMLGSGPGARLINLGNPKAWQWMVDMVDGQLTKEGIDLYRQDFNMEPLEAWRQADQPERQGITENKYISGYLAFWDELRRRHPGMLIDSCSSGGKRNELEAMRRAVPLWRSDYNNVGYVVFDYRIAPIDELPCALQCQTYGLANWLPYFGAPARDDDLYIFRSGMMPALGSAWNVENRKLDYDLLRRCYHEWRAVAGYMLGDFYPLTPYSQAADTWMAWQFDRPALEGGVVQAFRRSESPAYGYQFHLQGLDPQAKYELKDFDKEGTTVMTGGELMNQGLNINIGSQPGSALITYKKMDRGSF